MDKETLKKELKILGITPTNNKIKKSDVLKVIASEQTIRLLLRTFITMLGNKRYFHELEKLLKEKLKDLTPQEEQIIGYLIKDLNGVDDSWSRARRQARQIREGF